MVDQKIDECTYPRWRAGAANEYGVDLLDIAGIERLQHRDQPPRIIRGVA